MNSTVVYSMPTRRALASPYADTEQDTVESAEEVGQALKEKGAAVTLFPVYEERIDRIREIRSDLLCNIVEWTGLDLPLADKAFSLIEETKIPFTGASRACYMQTSDKVMMKTALVENNLPTARFQIFETGDEVPRKDFRFPVIVKPALEHCSIGLTHDAVVNDTDCLVRRVRERIKKFEEPMIVEEFIEGREFQVTAVETKSGLRVLPPAEIVFTSRNKDDLLTFDSRWDSDTVDYQSSHVALPVLHPALLADIEDVTIRTFSALKLRDYTRLDIRVRRKDIFILEANSNPGLSDDMEYGMTLSYKAVGWHFSDFVWEIVESALRRSHRRA